MDRIVLYILVAPLFDNEKMQKADGICLTSYCTTPLSYGWGVIGLANLDDLDIILCNTNTKKDRHIYRRS